MCNLQMRAGLHNLAIKHPTHETEFGVCWQYIHKLGCQWQTQITPAAGVYVCRYLDRQASTDTNKCCMHVGQKNKVETPEIYAQQIWQLHYCEAEHGTSRRHCTRTLPTEVHCPVILIDGNTHRSQHVTSAKQFFFTQHEMPGAATVSEYT